MTTIETEERVNITYKAKVGDQVEEKELPMKLLVLGDLLGRKDETPVEKRKPIKLDRYNFNEVLKSQDLEIELNVPNKISSKSDSTMAITLKFESIEDFSPDRISAKVEDIDKLIRMREALLTLKAPLFNLPDFRRKIEEIVKDDGKRRDLFKELGLGISEVD